MLNPDHSSRYLIDGYNLLFSILESKASFETQRQDLIFHLQKEFKKLGLKGILVFDGSHLRSEESGLSYKSPLEIVYTPKDQTADSYIVEKLSLMKNPKLMTVVTNDKGLHRHARSYQANVLSTFAFFQFLEKKQTKTKVEKLRKETPYNIERLLKIFENRFNTEEKE